MKKMMVIAALAAMTLGYSVAAQASPTDLFQDGNHYYGTFSGKEFATEGPDGQRITDPTRIIDANGNVQSGFTMTGLLYSTGLSSVDNPGNQGGSSPNLLPGDGGLLVSVLRGFEATYAYGNVNNPLTGGGIVGFEGGYLDLYYVPADIVAGLSNGFMDPHYITGGDFTYQDGSPIDFSLFNLLGTYELAATVAQFTGVASVGATNGDAQASVILYGDLVIPDGVSNVNLDNNLYGMLGNDLAIDAVLRWSQVTGEFSAESFDVSAQAYLSTTAVPEPTTMLLFGTGLMGIAALGRRVQRKRDAE